MGTKPLHTMTLTDEANSFDEERKILRRICNRQWKGLSEVDVAIARLKRMVIDQNFSFTYPMKRRQNGVMTTFYLTYRLKDYLPTRRTNLMKRWDETSVEILLDESFPDEVIEKNTKLRPLDGHIAHAAGQLLFPAGTTPIHAEDHVYACIRMMVAEYTRGWKHPRGKQPAYTKSPG